ncbi:MAG: helix-turn-helix domain-containing protein, partial [bacterium]|nr:helix-turn-helix domain-containing protein [bacterium]
MPSSRAGGLTIDFPIQACPHTECPYNPECPPEIVESLLAQLSPKLKLAVEYLRKNHKDPSFTIVSLGTEFNISLRCLEQLFSEELGYTPKECLEQIRINHYRKQLNEHEFRGVKETFGNAGFNSRGSFEYTRKKYPPPQ